MSFRTQAAMSAYGAELILVSREDSMEERANWGDKCSAKGGKVWNQVSAHDKARRTTVLLVPEIWRDTHGGLRNLISSMGNDEEPS